MSDRMRYVVIDTQLGPLTLASTVKGLALAHFGRKVPGGAVLDEKANRRFILQLEEYLDQRRTRFSFPLDIDGTSFQIAVWLELLRIPYGETRTYGQIASSVGRPQAARAVGMASHHNPVAIVIPCHRVVGHNGSLTGYAGGLQLKEKLLLMEQSFLGRGPDKVGNPMIGKGHL